jgi:hypothetical protein
LNSEVKVKVFDASGKLQMEKTLSANGGIDLSGLSNGIYILKVSDKNGMSQSARIVKE